MAIAIGIVWMKPRVSARPDCLRNLISQSLVWRRALFASPRHNLAGECSLAAVPSGIPRVRHWALGLGRSLRVPHDFLDAARLPGIGVRVFAGREPDIEAGGALLEPAPNLVDVLAVALRLLAVGFLEPRRQIGWVVPALPSHIDAVIEFETGKDLRRRHLECLLAQ